MKSKKEIEEYIGMKISSYNLIEVETSYGEEQIAYDRYVLGRRMPANYSLEKVLPQSVEKALEKLMKESAEKGDMETAATCHSILKETNYQKTISDIIGKENVTQIMELTEYENQQREMLFQKMKAKVEEQEEKAKAEEQAKIKAEQEAKAKAEEQAKIKAEQEEKAKAEEQAKIKAEQEAKAKAEEQAKIKAVQEAKAKAEEEAKIKAEQEAKAKVKREEEAQIKLKQEAREKERQESIDRDIREYEQYEELIEKKPELETIYNDLFYEDFSSQINGNVTDNMKNLMKRLKALPDEERKIILCRYNKNANYQINEKCEFVDEQVRESATQEINVEVEEQAQMKTEQVPETSREKDTNIGKDDESMLEAHFEYMKNHQTEQTSQVVEEYWNENHSQQAKAYEQQQTEKIKPREESIRDEIGDKIDKENNMQIQEKENSEVDVWMNRFNSWYNAIDRVSQNVKAKFVKMKSDIVNAISGKLKERMNQRQQNTQEQDSNER